MLLKWQTNKQELLKGKHDIKIKSLKSQSLASVHETNVMTYKFLPSKNADFPEDKSVICLSQEKMRELSAVAPSQFPLIIKMVEILKTLFRDFILIF